MKIRRATPYLAIVYRKVSGKSNLSERISKSPLDDPACKMG